MFPYYVPPTPKDAPKVRLGKNEKYSLETPIVSKGVWVMTNIIPNLHKMGFIDHDLQTFP